MPQLPSQQLKERDRNYLAARGISLATAIANGLRTNGRGMVIPYFNCDGSENGPPMLRPHVPKKDKDGKPIKFEFPKGIGNRAYIPASSRLAIAGGEEEIVLTESPIKALAAAEAGFVAIGINGANGGGAKGTKGAELIDDLKAVPWKGRIVYIVFDYDSKTKTRADVKLAAERQKKALEARGASAVIVDLPPGPDGGKQGLDDFIVANGAQAFAKLIEAARPSHASQVSQASQVFTGVYPGNVLARVIGFLGNFISLPERLLLIEAAWVLAAWLADKWDRFPHLAISSPEKRCGKTRNLQCLEQITPTAYQTTNISPAALYRMIEKLRPTLLLDEAQSLHRRGSESSEVIRELFNSSIDRDAKVLRCAGNSGSDLAEFYIYCPKVMALIGSPDGVLLDRCLPVRLRRKTTTDAVQPYRSRIVEPIGAQLRQEIEAWRDQQGDRVAQIYDELTPIEITNDRLAELLMPLQAVIASIDPSQLKELEAYAFDLDGAETDRHSPGVLLLAAIREVFGDRPFLSTADLLAALTKREEEPWHRWNRGQPITAEALASLLREFDVRPERKQTNLRLPGGKQQTVCTRGYFRIAFDAAWASYLTPLKKPD